MKIRHHGLFFFLSLNVVLGSEPANFFRSKNNHESKQGAIFDVLGWKIQLDGPMRGSAAFGNGAVFVGTAKGTFYAIGQSDGKILWTYETGSAIHSTAAFENGVLYFTDNSQTLHVLDAKKGKLKWKFNFQKRLPYEWKFDYWYSSPIIAGNSVLIGADDGFLYAIDKNSGKEIWKFNAGSVIRSTPTVDGNFVYFGDCSGLIFSVDLQTGKERWRYKTKGYDIVLGGEFYYDRKAVLASVVVAQNLCLVGSRDGFFYALNQSDGTLKWLVDYDITWVLSSVLIKDNLIITGTSDGRYVNALEIATGKEAWRHTTRNIVWSSPILINDWVYIPSGDGVLHILDYKTGKKLSEFRSATTTSVFSSPVFTGMSVIYPTDEGVLYSLFSRQVTQTKSRKLVFWMEHIQNYFRNKTDVRVRDYLVDNGYRVIDSTELIRVVAQMDSSDQTVIAFASNYFPETILRNEGSCALRRYLDRGGRLMNFGQNPAIYDPSGEKFDFTRAGKIFGVVYGPDDLRSFHGTYPSFPTELGKKYKLPPFWTSVSSVDTKQVDAALGVDENGLASAWIKNFGIGRFIQMPLDQSKPMDYNFLKFLGDVL